MRGATTTAQKRPALITDFNPRTSYEVRLIVVLYPLHHVLFQSTHLIRGATHCRSVSVASCLISIHAPHARCDFSPANLDDVVIISIHAPPCGVRHCDDAFDTYSARFQSTHLMQGTTEPVIVHVSQQIISIHAPHTRCDNIVGGIESFLANFNPRTPCGVRRVRDLFSSDRWKFQSTHPMRGATVMIWYSYNKVLISIHAPHAGCDSAGCC